MSDSLLRIGNLSVEPAVALVWLAAFVAILLLALMIMLLVGMARRAEEKRNKERDGAQLDAELAELKGRMQTIAEISVSRQSELTRSINQRLDSVTHKLGQNLNENSRKTGETLSKLNERLAVIDTAQKNITELSSNVVSLQEILANKQQRGAFGQGRMEAIIEDALPKGAFTFQATLSNNMRPDCLINLPNAPALVIDAKFPLEGFEALRLSRTDVAKKQAIAQIRTDVGTHIKAIAEKYLIPGETQDQALMFVPSESIYAELHETFPKLLQASHRARVVIVSPNMLMLAVQTMQAIMKDVQMREQAGLIQKEVANLMEDVNRLHDRVLKLQTHFGQAGKDIEQVLISSEKISSRSRKIESLDFDEAPKKVSSRAKMPASARKKKPAARARNGNGKQQDLLAGSQ